MTALTINQTFYLGSWLVTPDQNKLNNSKKEIFIEPKLMHVLNYLCINAPEVISSDRLIEYCWPNQYFSDNPLHKCIAQLRKILGDKAKQPVIIKTISKKGYAIIALIKGINPNPLSQKTSWLGKNPYLGLHHYKKEHSDIYFGRNKAISEVKSLFDKINQIDMPLLIIKGINGVGKTSLINCQIVPSLLTPVHPYQYSFTDTCSYNFERKHDTQFLLQFVNELIQMNVLEAHTKQKDYLSDISYSSNKLSVTHINQYSNTNNNPNKVIFFIDHLEKIISGKRNNLEELNAFFSIILQLINSGKYFFIFSIRTESYQNFDHSFVFKQLEEKSLHYNLLPPDVFEISEIIQKPVIAAGLSYEFNTTTFESLGTTIINDAVNISDILSILSHTLKELCANHNNKHQLTFESYKKIGRLKGALNYNVESIINKLSDHNKIIFNVILYNFIHVDSDKFNGYVCVKVNIKTFKNRATIKLLHSLLEDGLLQSHIHLGQTYISILHPSIIHESEFFQKWITDNHLKLSIITEIRTLANQWLFNHKDKNYLLKNTNLLGQINTLTNKDNIKVNLNEKQFLLKSNQQHKLINKFKILFLSILCTLLILSTLLLIENKKSNEQLTEINNKAENLITFMLGDLKDTLRPYGKLDQLKSIGTQIISYYNNRTKLEQSESSTLQFYKALSIIGEVDVIRGELNRAASIFQQATKHDIKFFKLKELKLPILIHYSQSNYWLGYISLLKKDFSKAGYFWNKYLSLSDKLRKLQPQNEKWLLENSYALNNLGTLYYKQKKYTIANNYFQKSAQIKKQLLNDHPNNTDYIVGLADTISWQANIMEKNNNLIQSNKLHLKSVNLTKKLPAIDATKNLWKHRLALAYYRLALSHYQLGELNKTMSYLLQSIPIYNQLNEFDETNMLWIKELVNNVILISKVYRHNNDIDNALLNLNKSLIIYESYSPESKKLKAANIQNLLIKSEYSLIHLKLGQNKTALDLFTKQLNKFESLNYFHKSYHHAYINFILAKLYFANNKKELAISLLKESIQILQISILTTEEKRHVALYVAIKQIVGLNKPTIKLISKLNKMNYQNPDFNLQKRK